MAKKPNAVEHFEVSFADRSIVDGEVTAVRRVALAHSEDQAKELVQSFRLENQGRREQLMPTLEDIQVHRVSTARQPHELDLTDVE
jgi:hypothetical protein